jgi:hypothetical protein
MPSIINSDDGVVSGSAGLKTTGGNDGLLNIQTNGSTAMSINASQQVTFNNGVTMPNTFGFENRLINGAMVIDQRNAGASVTPTDAQYTLDRWNAGLTQASKFSVQRSTVAPAGYTNSLLVTSLSAYSVGAGDLFRVSQYIEGFNVADLGWGTASAATVTLSFWVRSSLTGTFSGALLNSGVNRSYPFTFSISAANTWEQKSVTIAGDTTGTWLTDNGIGIRVGFSLGAGSSFSGTAGAWSGSTFTAATGAVSVVGTNGATFYVTGVQFERGSAATSFDFRSITQELALCQRYYLKLGPGSNFFSFDNYNTTSASCNIHFPFPVAMRATPTGSISAIGDFGFSNTSSGNFAATGLTSTTGRIGTDATGTGRCQWYTNNANAFAAYSIEL